MGKTVPLLLISDAVSATSGLARITRDLAVRIHEHLGDVYRVGTLGYGGSGSRQFSFPQYTIEGMGGDWVIPNLPEVWNDFAGQEHGIILVIWDISRVGWFSQPERLGAEVLAKFPGLKEWLIKGNFERWIYCPLDASGPNDRLTFPLQLGLMGFDRILAYGSFGEGVIRRTIGDEESDKRHLTNLPHGLDAEVFYELPRKLCRKLFFQHTGAFPLINMEVPPIAEDEILIGCVSTNQARKDWSLVAESVAILAKTNKVRLWAHTDQLERAWSIPALLVDYGIIDKTVVSLGHLSDERMAEAYSACDLTLGSGLGEGMGYPIHESLFCGTPCLHGNYGGAPEWMLGRAQGMAIKHCYDPLLVEPVAYRYEGVYASKRPVFSAKDWAEKAACLIGKRMNHNGDIDWSNLWQRWAAYLRKAAE